MCDAQVRGERRGGEGRERGVRGEKRGVRGEREGRFRYVGACEGKGGEICV